MPVQITLRIGSAALILALSPATTLAQEGKAYRVESEVSAPIGPDGSTIEDLARRSGSRSGMTYADGLSGDLASGYKAPPKRQEEPSELNLPIWGGSGGGVYLALALCVGALLIWLRFGGAGNLLKARPKVDQRPEPQAAPEAWAIHADDLAMGPEALIRRLLALPDRGQAAAGLLRHSLLAAANETQIRLARSDTERQAFDRLPRDWRQYGGLKTLSQLAELAHYGGRPVSDEVIEQLAQIARAILIPSGQPRGKNA